MDTQQLSERLLIIDDDGELCSLLALYLKTNGFELHAAHDGRSGIGMIATGIYRLVILDIMLPGNLNGLDVLRRLREKTTLPILILSAKGDDIDRVVGLELGADDYLAKPFHPRELNARIRAILRRTDVVKRLEQENAGQYQYGDIELNVVSRSLTCMGRLVHLTPLEFNILEVLIRHAGKEVTREALAEDIFGRPLSPYDRNIDVHISQLRKKLGKRSDHSERIQSVRGSGYVFTLLAPT